MQLLTDTPVPSPFHRSWLHSPELSYAGATFKHALPVHGQSRAYEHSVMPNTQLHIHSLFLVQTEEWNWAYLLTVVSGANAGA